MPRTTIFAASAFMALEVLLNAGLAAPPKLDLLFPAGAGRGQTVSVAATGTFGKWPVQTWASNAGVTIEAEAEKGKLKVVVASDAEPGICWIRLADAEGASSPRPLVIGTLPEVVETEPNDGPAKVQQLTGSAIVNGRFNKAGDVDVYSLQLTKGQTLVASLLANKVLASPCDAVLQVCNPEGSVLAQNDDARGIDPELVFVAPRDGVYLVRAFAFPLVPDSTIGFAGGDTFIYRLTLTTGGFVDYALPLFVSRDVSTEVEIFGWNLPAEAKKLTLPAVGERQTVSLAHPLVANSLSLPAAEGKIFVAAAASGPAQPQPVELPAAISGCIEVPRDVDAFSFTAKKGAKLSVQVDAFDLGFPLDPYLQVTDAAGKVLAEIDDSKKQRDADLAFSPPADGEYRVLVRDLHRHGGPRYAYRLSIGEAEPDFDLKLAADSFLLTPGKPLEIPVTIDRRGGFSGEMEITAVGLPEGVVAAPVKSQGKGDSAKAVKLALTAEKGPYSGSFRIVGAAAGEPMLRKTARYPLTAFGIELTDVWLTVTEKQ